MDDIKSSIIILIEITEDEELLKLIYSLLKAAK